MSKILPRFKHRTVGPKKGTGSVYIKKITLKKNIKKDESEPESWILTATLEELINNE